MKKLLYGLTLVCILGCSTSNEKVSASFDKSTVLANWNDATKIFIREKCYYPKIAHLEQHLYNHVRIKLLDLLISFFDSNEIVYVIELGEITYQDEYIDIRLCTEDKKSIYLRYLPEYENFVFLAYEENIDCSSLQTGCIKEGYIDITKTSIISIWDGNEMHVKTINYY